MYLTKNRYVKLALKLIKKFAKIRIHSFGIGWWIRWATYYTQIHKVFFNSLCEKKISSKSTLEDFRWFNLTNFLGTCIHRSQWCKGSPERLGRALASFSYDVFSVKLKGHFHYLHRIRQNYQTCLNLSVSWSGTDPSPWNLKQKQRINIHTKIFVKLREVREFLGWNKCGIHQMVSRTFVNNESTNF